MTKELSEQEMLCEINRVLRSNFKTMEAAKEYFNNMYRPNRGIDIPAALQKLTISGPIKARNTLKRRYNRKK